MNIDFDKIEIPDIDLSLIELDIDLSSIPDIDLSSLSDIELNLDKIELPELELDIDIDIDSLPIIDLDSLFILCQSNKKAFIN